MSRSWSIALLLLGLSACVGGLGDKSDDDDEDSDEDDGGDEGGGSGGGLGGGGDGDDAGCTDGIEFGAETEWSLPDMGWAQSNGDPPFDLTSQGITADCAGGRDFYYSTVDITGDGVPDIVATRNGCEGSSVGESKWEVYEGGSSGFSDSSTSWSLPDMGWTQTNGDPPFDLTAQGISADCGGGRDYYYSVFDLTGDGAPDLVVTRNGCEGGTVGESNWQVYQNTGSGFADSPVSWSLPDVGWTQTNGDPPFDLTAQGISADCAGGRDYYYATFDVTGDDTPDLVVTRNGCEGSRVGEVHWEVYEGGSSGFADSATEWTLPDVGWTQSNGDPPFDLTAQGITADCASGRDYYYSTFDLSGDGQVDIVVTRNGCEGSSVGEAYWEIYEGGDGGFAESPSELALPEPGFGQSNGDPVFDLTSQGISADCASGRDVYYSLLDVDGNGVPEIVLTRNGCDGVTVGTDFWTTWLGECI